MLLLFVAVIKVMVAFTMSLAFIMIVFVDITYYIGLAFHFVSSETYPFLYIITRGEIHDVAEVDLYWQRN